MKLALLLLAAAPCLALVTPSFAQQAPDPGNATWHIGLFELFGKGEVTVRKDYNLNLYAVFENGRFSHALGSARAFNTSLHFVEKADIKLDGNKVSGKFGVLLTPDLWVPRSHQCVTMDVEIDGVLAPGKDRDGKPTLGLSGVYRGVMHGSSEGPGPDTKVEGKLTGGVGASEPGWENARLQALMNPSPQPGEPTEAAVAVELGCSDGKVHWGTVGTSWLKEFRGGRRVAIDVSGLKYSGSFVTGSFKVPYRAIDITCEPGDEAEVNLTFSRVQGMVGGKAQIIVRRGGREIAQLWAYGRGGGTKGAGGPKEPAAPAPVWEDKPILDPWFAPTKDFKPVAAGEHPRLLFRKSDVPALRQKAQTPEGKAILARLRLLLDGRNGDTMPTRFNTTPPDNHAKSPKLPPGTFTSWHGSGYGLLYQLTSEQKYADLARESLEHMFNGKMDIDNRYGWAVPGTLMRAGSVMAGVGLAYDLCYEAWPEDFRKRVVREIQEYNKPCAPSDGKQGKENVTLPILVTAQGYPPGSNHYGSYLGAGVAVLAIMGDPGADDAKLARYLGYAERNAVRMVTHGFGDGGAYPEGHHPPRVSSNGGYLEFITALRNAAGRDYSAVHPNVSWITLRWVMETAMDMSLMHRGVYGGDTLESGGLSHDGEIPNGFATLPEKFKPALLWFYQEAYGKAHHDNWGAATYPHRAVYSFVYWPVGSKAANPADIMPRTAVDTLHGYFYARRSWKDINDIVVTHAMETGPGGYYDLSGKGMKDRGCWLKGMGFHKVRFPAPRGTVTAYLTSPDGSTILSALADGPVPASLAFDFSGASGAEALLVSVGSKLEDKLPNAEKKERAAITPMALKVGEQTFNLLALHSGAAPNASVEGDTIRIGEQTIKFDGKRLVMGKWSGPQK